MRALVLGGTRFLGRHVVDGCRAAGHSVAVFHRGLSDPTAFPEVEHILGDREASLDALRGRSWDAVFDTSGYEVAPVRNAARAVAAPEVHYAFVSSISVYSDFTRPADESAPVKSVADPEHTTLSLDAYGGLKAACERAAEEALPGRVQCVRAGIILGPHDNDARFAYWLRRVARGGEVLAPGEPTARVQFIDARDLAGWMVHCAERRTTGVFNATGPGEPTTLRDLLHIIRDVTGSDARFTWVRDQVLLAGNVAPYSEMPFWLPASHRAFHADVGRAVGAGLVHRPIVETVRDAWAWLQVGWSTASAAGARAHRRLSIPAGIAPEREAALLAEARRVGAAAPD